jgi:hypothetical protein
LPTSRPPLPACEQQKSSQIRVGRGRTQRSIRAAIRSAASWSACGRTWL